MRIRIVTLLAAAALCAACAGRQEPWEELDRDYSSGNWIGPRFSLRFPDDWMQLNGVEHGLVATRDGFNLQAIKVRRIELRKPLPHTKKTVVPGMRPAEVAEVLVDDVRSDPTAKGLKVLETRPATIAGAQGFRTSLAFKDEYGLKLRAVVCGALVGDYAWQLTYVAPARYYYDRDLSTFDQALASFAIR